MFAGHAQNWLVDNVAFAISLLPLASLSLVVLAARLESERLTGRVDQTVQRRVFQVHSLRKPLRKRAVRHSEVIFRGLNCALRAPLVKKRLKVRGEAPHPLLKYSCGLANADV